MKSYKKLALMFATLIPMIVPLIYAVTVPKEARPTYAETAVLLYCAFWFAIGIALAISAIKGVSHE